MADHNYRKLIDDGFWNNNAGLVQILGLCPLLAVTATLINGLGLGLATTFVLVGSNVTVSLVRQLVPPEVRIPIFVLIIASFVTATELILNAWFHDLYNVLGIFIPLIVTNCVIIGRAEAFASKNPILPSLVDGLSMGLGFTALLVVLGAGRELIGNGTLFDHAHLMFGDFGYSLTTTVIPDYGGFLLAILPPGAFIGMGLLIALKNVIDARKKEATPATVAAPTTDSDAGANTLPAKG
jgi:electron transport complex protein RnfE